MKCVLLLHGFLSDENDFASIIDLLKARYDLVHCIHFPGHGVMFNQEEFTEEATFELLEMTYQNLAKRYQIIDVIGFSMGGALGVNLACKYPIHRLVLLAPAYNYFNLEAPLAKVGMYWKLAKKMREARKEHGLNNEKKVAQKLNFLMEDDKRSINFVARAYLNTAMPKYFMTFRKIIKRVVAEMIPYQCPTLVLWGELDQLVPRKAIEEVYEFCVSTQKKKIIYDDITHLMLLSTSNQKIINDIIIYLEERD
ncbi:MAG: alpha/beta hydrolase [Bacilli bacterium]